MNHLHYLNPVLMIKNLWAHRELVAQFAKRDTLTRYKGSYLGIFWSFVNPLVMLVIYTFVFSVIFKSKWGAGGQEENIFTFGLTLFSGMIVFNIFSEVITRSTTIILGHPNYVKKVVFPLEVFPVVLLITALVNAVLSLVVLVLFAVLLQVPLHWGGLLLPVLLLPILLLSVGLGWLLAALGVFIRDIGHVIHLVVQMLMFLSPVFYPINVVPEALRPLYSLNPLGIVIENMRAVLLWGQAPNWNAWGGVTLVAIAACMIGHYIFQRCKVAFADVI